MADVQTRKNGKPLGRKGTETRQKLIQSASELLSALMPMELTASEVAKHAGSSTATFYVYFSDIEDLLWWMCSEITNDTIDLFADDAILRVSERLEQDAFELLTNYSKIWHQNSKLLIYRNLQADSGNRRFNALLTKTGLPIMQGITDRIIAARGAENISRRDANAEAVVIMSAMDRLAGAVALYPEDSVMPDVLLRAQARIIARMLEHRESMPEIRDGSLRIAASE